MKKILLLSLTILLGACTFYPLGMSEAEWNSLSKQERMEARREEARLREQRQIRYAIERQNRLKEDRINADTNATNSTAQAASAAASAAQAASVAQQSSQNNITFNPNIVVSNTNQNDLANISSNTNSQDQSNNQNATGSNNTGSGSSWNNGNVCKKYDTFMRQGKKFFTEGKYKQSVDMYTKAVKRACTDKQKKIAQEHLAAAQEALENSPSGNNGGNKSKLLKKFRKN